MTHFVGAGTIASDIVRKETRNGVLATFRLATGPPGRGQIWIDVEAWGNLAGTIYQHGSNERGVVVAGRLTLKTWRDRSTGQSRHRYVITANDIDLLPDQLEVSTGSECHNTVLTAGVIDSDPTTRPAGSGHVTEFRLAAGRAGAKTGRLWIDVEFWQPNKTLACCQRCQVIVTGRLAYGGRGVHRGEAERGRYYISARAIQSLATGHQGHAPKDAA